MEAMKRPDVKKNKKRGDEGRDRKVGVQRERNTVGSKGRMVRVRL